VSESGRENSVPAQANVVSLPRPPRPADETEARESRWSARLLVALLVFVSVALALQTLRARSLSQHVSSLESELSASNSALAEARGRLAAYQSRVAGVRDTVEQLRSQLAELDALAADAPETRAPGAGAAIPPAGDPEATPQELEAGAAFETPAATGPGAP